MSSMQTFAQSATVHDTAIIVMGTGFRLKAVAPSRTSAHTAVIEGLKEAQRIETVISSHIASSETSWINQNAGIRPVKVSMELFALIELAIKISQLTDGAFDITFAPLYEVWKFKDEFTEFPASELIEKQKKLVGYRKIILNAADTSVFLPIAGMRIDFGAIGKGYAANKAKVVMKKCGAVGGFVDASGDILFWGRNQFDEPWNVAISSPNNKNEIIGNLKVADMAVVTSGNYEKYFLHNGNKYSHIIDPKSGYPVIDIISATIFGPDAEIADALATSVSVLGVEQGLKLINQLEHIECLLIDVDKKIYKSDKLTLSPP